jgi:hypothetical protein
MKSAQETNSDGGDNGARTARVSTAAALSGWNPTTTLSSSDSVGASRGQLSLHNSWLSTLVMLQAHGVAGTRVPQSGQALPLRRSARCAFLPECLPRCLGQYFVVTLGGTNSSPHSR